MTARGGGGDLGRGEVTGKDRWRGRMREGEGAREDEGGRRSVRGGGREKE